MQPVIAQVAPSTVDSVTQTFVQQGVIGVMLLLAIYTIYKIAIAYANVQEKRIDEAKLAVTALHDINSTLRDLTKVIQVAVDNYKRP